MWWIDNKILITNISNLPIDKKYWYNKIVFKHKNNVYDSIGINFMLTKEFEELTTTLINTFHSITKKEYSKVFGDYKLLKENKNICWAYVRNKNDFDTCIHHHIKTSTINSVFYLNVPSKKTGGITFYRNIDNKFLTYYPNDFDLIIFPNYLLHEPEKSESEEYRIAINMEIICERVQSSS